METAFARIEELKADYASDLVWGIRFDVEGLTAGHIFGASRIWVDNQPTTGLLGGTSILTSLNTASQYESIGTGYIVCGYLVEVGQDRGEMVVSECEIIETI